MNKQKIMFIAHYDSPENYEQQRSVALSACNKMDFVINTLRNLGYDVEVISLATTYGMEDASAKQYYTKDGIGVRLFYAIGRKRGIIRVLNRITIRLQALICLLRNIKKDEIIFAYHAMSLIPVITVVKWLAGCKLILEMEEIYGDVSGKQEWRKRELNFAKLADAYIFPTQLLNDVINKQNKPAVIAHGTYQTEAERGCDVFQERGWDFDPAKIHCVYAGTLDPRKGAAAAVAAAEFLPENYHIHILGFGNEKEKRDIRDLVEKYAKSCKCGISYDGLLSGEDYIRFIQSCDIGLSTQDPTAAFNATSFPSKVLSYMANGLRVVSIRIEAIERSAVNDLITYYDMQTPEEIAKAIMRVNMDEDYDSRERIAELDNVFTQELHKILGELNNGS